MGMIHGRTAAAKSCWMVRFDLSDHGQLQADQAFPGYARWDLSVMLTLHRLIDVPGDGEALVSIRVWWVEVYRIYILYIEREIEIMIDSYIDMLTLCIRICM